jgi:hypothetical protein
MRKAHAPHEAAFEAGLGGRRHQRDVDAVEELLHRRAVELGLAEAIGHVEERGHARAAVGHALAQGVGQLGCVVAGRDQRGDDRAGGGADQAARREAAGLELGDGADEDRALGAAALEGHVEVHGAIVPAG